MDYLISFLVLMLAGLFLSDMFRRLHLPYVIALIIAGVIIGPYGLDILEVNGPIEFLGSIGLVFLMFMAGLEIRWKGIDKVKRNAAKVSILNGLIPFVVGFFIANYFGYDFIASLLLGTIFISSSIAVVIPSLEANKLFESKLGKSIVAATMFEDIFSLILLSFVLQIINPMTTLPLPIFYILFFSAVIGIRIAVPELRKMFCPECKKDVFEEQVMFIFAVLLGTVVIFELLGIHSIIAGFFTGLVLSQSMRRNEIVVKKLHALSYGLFIPAFFIIIGVETDVSVFLDAGDAVTLTLFVVVGSILAKFISGYVGGRVGGFRSDQSVLIGASTIPQLSTTLAVAFVGLELGILDHRLVTAMIVLSMVTTFVGPLLMSWAVGRIIKR